MAFFRRLGCTPGATYPQALIDMLTFRHLTRRAIKRTRPGR